MDSLSSYIQSPYYEEDLSSTIQLWRIPHFGSEAGMFILITYATIPNLLEVFSGSTNPSIATERFHSSEKREKMFLSRLIGIRDEEKWSGGIKNPLVQEMARNLWRDHSNYSGMTAEYMHFIGSIIALSILRRYACQNIWISPEVKIRYWRYISQAMSIMDIQLGSESEENAICIDFSMRWSGSSKNGRRILHTLSLNYPTDYKAAYGILYPPALSIVSELGLGI